MNDWRLQGQEKFLHGVSLSKRKYKKLREEWDHDHCEFCSVKFSERQGDVNEGYVTLDNYHWICEDCFEDFKTMFKWNLISE